MFWLNPHQHPLCSKGGGEAQPLSCSLPSSQVAAREDQDPTGSFPFSAATLSYSWAFCLPTAADNRGTSSCYQAVPVARPQHGDAVEISAFS